MSKNSGLGRTGTNLRGVAIAPENELCAPLQQGLVLDELCKCLTRMPPFAPRGSHLSERVVLNPLKVFDLKNI